MNDDEELARVVFAITGVLLVLAVILYVYLG